MSIDEKAPNEIPEDIYGRVKYFAETILREAETNPENTLTTPQLFEKVGPRFGQDAIPNKNTFGAFLSRAAKEKSSKIVLKARRKGFYFKEVKEVVPAIPISESITPLEMGLTKRRIEAALYPIVRNWLVEEGYDSRITDHTRSGGKWGNPDVTGIKFTENFDSSELEIVTVEVKATSEDWERQIFEAISHRRFSNRTYFAFAVDEDWANKLDMDLRYYADLYRIGVLLIEFSSSDFKNFVDGKPISADPSTVIVNEIYSAPFNEIRAEYKRRFLNETLKISSIKELLRFFDSDDLEVDPHGKAA